jgi:hypothetical protein
MANTLTLDLALSGDADQAKEALTKISEVDLSDPVKGFQKLNELASDSNETLSSLANNLLKSPLYSL